MKHLYLVFALTSLFLTFPGTGVRAQTTIAVMDFDGTTPEMTIATNVTFFDIGSDGFFGIHDANGNLTDGTPDDTGDGNASDIAAITLPAISGDFLFVNDLARENDMEPGTLVGETATVTFGPVTVSGETGLLFSFDYDVVGFEASDLAVYELFVDGAGQGEVDLLQGASGPRTFSGRADAIIPDNSTSVYLELRITQNGDSDQAGFDNFSVTAGNTGLPCGVTSFGPTATTICATNSNDPNTDTYAVSIPFSGTDAGAIVTLTVDGNPAVFDDSNGSDPTTDNGGVLVLTSGDLVEGTSFEVALTGGNCNYLVTGSVAANACEDGCDLGLAGVTVVCEDFTSADNADGITVEIDYTGVESGAGVSATGLTVGGDDPGSEPDGTIILSGAVEGGSYLVTISGGSCTSSPINIPVVVPSDACTPTDLVVNEVLADPGSVNDANNDGAFDGSEDEFIELYNTADTELDVSGFTISEGAGVRYTFPAGSVIPPRSAFVLFGGGTPNVPCFNSTADTPFIGLNNTGDRVSVRNATGITVAQMQYGAEGNNDQSLALNPDGDVASGYVLHTTIANPSGAPLTHSACLENDDPQFVLPVELLSFTATTTAKTVELAWVTANEVANDRFVVERSAAGQRWEQVGTVRAAGRSNGDYSFVDAQPLDGRSLYRLRQIDLDGSFALYGPLAVEFAAGDLAVYPNPTGNELRFNQPLEATTATLFGGSGKALRQVLVNDGRVDVSALRPGIYLLRVELDGVVETLRFVKR